MMTNAENLSKSRYYSLQRLDEGVYAALAVEDGPAICNAGVIDLGDRTLVFDTFLNPPAAAELAAATSVRTP